MDGLEEQSAPLLPRPPPSQQSVAGTIVDLFAVLVLLLVATAIALPLILSLQVLRNERVQVEEVGAVEAPAQGLAKGCRLRVVDGKDVVLENGFTKAVFSLASGSLTSLQADFEGESVYGPNVLSYGRGLRTEVVTELHPQLNLAPLSTAVPATTVANSSEAVSVSLGPFVDATGTAEETWVLALEQNTRELVVSIQGRLVHDVKLRALRHSVYTETTSVTAFFGRGVVQMRNAFEGVADHFASRDSLNRAFMVGAPPHSASNNPRALEVAIAAPGRNQTVLFTQQRWSGIQEVVLGDFGYFDSWCGGWQNASSHHFTAPSTWNSTWKITPSDGDFPASTAAVSSANTPLSRDIRGILTSVYATVAGTLSSYNNDTPGQIQPSVHNPVSGYDFTSNYFDPDSFLALTALLHSGDPYLHEEVRKVLERTAQFVRATGEIPHHLEYQNRRHPAVVHPVFTALSGASLLGPNVFWTLACVEYVKIAGDVGWLEKHAGQLRTALQYLLARYDPDLGLLSVSGPLMIDVFRREHVTSDTNAMMVHVLHEFAEIESVLGNATGSAQLLSLADDMSSAINTMLWSEDHFITQLNPDGSTTDFVDYDANLIAIAANVTSFERASRILQRIDAGRCAHASPTFVSEKWYGPKDCYRRNVGDSWTAMGRVAYFDALARRVMWDKARRNEPGSQQGAQQHVLMANGIVDRLRDEVLAHTWLHERYGCDGKPQTNRTWGYFEFPAVFTSLSTRLRFGIHYGVASLTISPLPPARPFSYHIGATHVTWSHWSVVISLPGRTRVLTVSISGMVEWGRYTVGVGGVGCDSEENVVQANGRGVLVFDAHVGKECVVRVETDKAHLPKHPNLFNALQQKKSTTAVPNAEASEQWTQG